MSVKLGASFAKDPLHSCADSTRAVKMEGEQGSVLGRPSEQAEALAGADHPAGCNGALIHPAVNIKLEPVQASMKVEPMPEHCGSNEAASLPSSAVRAAAALAASVRAQSAAGASADGPAPFVRRSSREAKSRIIMVDGHPVLKSNNYDLEQGERSVFEMELKRPGEPANGARVKVERPLSIKRELPLHIRRPHKSINPAEQVRHEHNTSIRTAASAMEGRRAQFFNRHMDVLTPFITPRAAATIRDKAAAHDASTDPKVEPVMEQPQCVVGPMRDYQLEGLRWLVSRVGDSGVNAILADEMGLGKTLQTIAFLAYMQTVRQVAGPSLVVVPMSVLSSWTKEFARWAPHLRVVRVHTSTPEDKMRIRKEVLANPSSFDVAVTTYDMIGSKDLGNSMSRTITWRYLILDEGHKIKNELTQVAQRMRHVSCQNVMLLTGTPLQNNLHELYALLSFMHPDIFTTSEPFDQAFDLTRNRVDNDALEAAHRLLQPICLRRLKEDVEKTLPARVETRIHCPLSSMQTFWYRRLLLKDSAMLKSLEKEVSKEEGVKYEEGNDTWKKLQALFMQLRKCCNHPYLFPGAEADFDGNQTGEDLVEASGKLAVLDRMLAMLHERGHRVTLFSQFNIMLDIIEDYLIMRGYKYVRLDGSTSRVQRMIDINRFNAPNSNLFIYILNTKAGGLGVNLQTADTCILYDSDWNPQWDLQAMARVHRIGQTKTCHVYRLCTSGTIEQRIQQRAEKKLFLDKMVNSGQTEGTEELEKMSKVEMLSMLRFGADRIFANEEGEAPTDQELAAIIDRSITLGQSAGMGAGESIKAEEAGAVAVPTSTAQEASISLIAKKQSAADFNAEEVPMSSYVLNGVDYTAARSVKSITEEWKTMKKRKGNARLITIDGHAVLKENNYSLEQGEPSVFAREAKRTAMPVIDGRRKRQVPGVDYHHSEFCQVCWDGGDVVLCDGCPAAYHPECLGLTMQELDAVKTWKCPHHHCGECGRAATKAGGLLFACQACDAAFCEDHLPADAHFVYECARFQHMGHLHPKQACYIMCSERCKAYVDNEPDVFDGERIAAAAASKKRART
ncbi:probable global transcription activator SNF2L1 [Coccomyxa sp. Obi]|nr:probable global transcription activator SNF2L1 [Coccomyxa sp. Obi]